jgi:hypothetical protein
MTVKLGVPSSSCQTQQTRRSVTFGEAVPDMRSAARMASIRHTCRPDGLGLPRAFFHPDYTVGSGVSPDPARLHTSLAGYTADRELELHVPHPAPKVLVYCQ